MNPTQARDIKAGVDLGRLRASLAPVLSAHGMALVDVAWQTDRAGWVLRLTIEREGSIEESGGVTLDDCAEVSRDASVVLDAEDLIPNHYHLEVSSPGLDRPLRTEVELARFAGKTAKVKLGRPAPDGQRVLRGTLDRAPEGRVAVIVDGKRIEVAFVDITEANLVFELAAQPKKSLVNDGGSAPKPREKGTAPKSRKHNDGGPAPGTPARPARSS